MGASLSVSTWSLHRTLGQPDLYGPEQGFLIPPRKPEKNVLSLFQLPAHLAEHGIFTLELCHFHLPQLDREYLADVRAALEASRIELFSLLIDDGDLTHPINALRDMEWIRSWIDVAGQLGARRVRVIAGKAPFSAEALDQSVHFLRQLAEHAHGWGIRLMTENWFGLLSQPAAVKALLERLEGNAGLCFDFGNWRGPTKYDDLRAIASFAESCHAKAHFTALGRMDVDDYVRCLNITQAVGFSGPYTLIYDGPDEDEWAGLNREREVVGPYLAQSQPFSDMHSPN